MSEGKLDIAAEGQTVAQAATGPQAQASFKTGEAAEQVMTREPLCHTIPKPSSVVDEHVESCPQGLSHHDHTTGKRG